MEKRNLFDCLPVGQGFERFDSLLETETFSLERIVSCGYGAPLGEWCDQERSEWVVLLKGSAGLRVEGEAEIRVLTPGDYVYLPARLRHRVEWTEDNVKTVWLALHHGD